jgi:endoglucanase
MEKNKISWIDWAVTDKNEACSALLRSADSNGQWKETDLNESGKYIRSVLRKFVEVPQ